MNSQALTNGATVPPSEEENLFRAATGLPFRCGICGRRHRQRDDSKSLTTCLRKFRRALRLITEGSRPKLCWRPSIETPTHVTFEKMAPNRVREIWPTSDLFDALHPSLARELEDLETRISNTYQLAHTDEVALIEAIAHTDPVGYIRKRLNKFIDEYERYRDIIYAEQEHIIRPLADRLRDWRSKPPEQFNVDKIFRSTSSDTKWEGTRGPDPISYLTINGHILFANSLLGEFPTVDLFSALWTSHQSQSWHRVLHDLGLIDGVPAISWAMRLTRSESRITQADIRLVTLLTGRNFLNNTGEYEINKLTLHAGDVIEGLLHKQKLVELSPPKKHE